MPEFRGGRVTNERMLNSGTIARWKSLTLVETSVDDDGIEALVEKAVRLEEIHFASKYISDRSMAALCSLQNLRSLLIEKSPITDVGAGYIPLANELSEVYLNNTLVTNEATRFLACQVGIWSLSLRNTRIGDKGIERLGELTQLRIVDLSQTDTEGFGFKCLSNNESMSVYLERCPIQDAGALALVKSLSKASIIDLSYTLISDATVVAASSLPLLSELRLSGTRVTDAGVSHLVGHESLMMLYVDGTSVTSGMVEKLKAESPNEMSIYTQSYS